MPQKSQRAATLGQSLLSYLANSKMSLQANWECREGIYVKLLTFLVADWEYG